MNPGHLARPAALSYPRPLCACLFISGEQGKEHYFSPATATAPRQLAIGRGETTVDASASGRGTRARRRLLWTEAVTAIEIAAAQSRMSSIMGKISIFDPSVQAIFMPNSGTPLHAPEQTNQPGKGSRAFTLSGEACANVIKTLRTMPSTNSVPRRTV